AEVSGSGSHGKITREDILAAVAARSAAAGGGTQRGERVIPMKGMRKVIADRMQESLRVHAQLTHTVRADMTNAAALREAYKKVDKKVSYNDIVLKA
ncbi:2-oxo acid dehydrogenase subunit E2, partial [Christensenella hongkongensis]